MALGNREDGVADVSLALRRCTLVSPFLQIRRATAGLPFAVAGLLRRATLARGKRVVSKNENRRISRSAARASEAIRRERMRILIAPPLGGRRQGGAANV